MSGKSHIVFAAFSSMNDPRLQGWAKLRGQITAGSTFFEQVADVSTSPATAWNQPNLATVQAGIWRLVAANNRELARSSSVYSSFRAARAHVLRLQSLAEELVATSVTGPAAGTHGFLLTLNDTVVMTNARWYSAVSSSLDVAAATVLALAAASVMTDARSAGSPVKRPAAGRTETIQTASW